MTKVILKLEVNDEKSKQTVMSTACTLSGVNSISMNMKEKKMTVKGSVDPVSLANKLRKICHTVILSVEQDKVEKKPEPKKTEPKKEDKKKQEQIAQLIKAFKT